jgi:hypothetical protein
VSLHHYSRIVYRSKLNNMYANYTHQPVLLYPRLQNRLFCTRIDSQSIYLEVRIAHRSISLPSHTFIDIIMFGGSPFSNNRRPTINDPRQPPYNAATTHPASIRPPSSFSPQAHGQNRVHVTLAGQGCDKERAWIDQWQTMKEHWHPAALAPGKSVGGNANAGASGQAAVGAEQTRSKL